MAIMGPECVKTQVAGDPSQKRDCLGRYRDYGSVLLMDYISLADGRSANRLLDIHMEDGQEQTFRYV